MSAAAAERASAEGFPAMAHSVLFRTVVLSALTLVLGGSAFEQDSRPAGEPKFSDLAFLSGAWTAKQGKAEVEEFWTPLRAGSLLGSNRTVAGDRTVAFEHLRIVERKTGVFYCSQPNGAKATEFKLTKSGPGEAIFENPEHDFPTKIAYVKRADGVVVATISGMQGGKSQSMSWNFAPSK